MGSEKLKSSMGSYQASASSAVPALPSDSDRESFSMKPGYCGGKSSGGPQIACDDAVEEDSEAVE